MRQTTSLLGMSSCTSADCYGLTAGWSNQGVLNVDLMRMDHVWLARRPSALIHRDLGMVFCLATLIAMNGGRKQLVALQLADQPLPALARLIIAKKAAASIFWEELADFVSLNLCPTDWLPAVP